MIPRYMRVVYWVLVASIVVMAIVLVVSRVQDRERMVAMRDRSPIAAPTDIAHEDVSVAVANDADGSIALDSISLALPSEPSLRARALIDRTLSDLSLPASTHPVPAGPSVTDVFLVQLPLRNPGATIGDGPSSYNASAYGGFGQLAVVNLTKAFADAHPSGIECEDLTLRAILATLHANFADITEVRFLVDGQKRDTLAGHADLTRAYAISDPAQSIHVVVQ